MNSLQNEVRKLRLLAYKYRELLATPLDNPWCIWKEMWNFSVHVWGIGWYLFLHNYTVLGMKRGTEHNFSFLAISWPWSMLSTHTTYQHNPQSLLINLIMMIMYHVTVTCDTTIGLIATWFSKTVRQIISTKLRVKVWNFSSETMPYRSIF